MANAIKESRPMPTCPKCGMHYALGLPEDEREHKQYHDCVVNGVSSRPLKADRIIWQESVRRVTLVTSYSPISQRKRAAATAMVANLEAQYTGGIYSADGLPNDGDIHLFMYHARNRIVGLVILEKKRTVWQCRWREGAPIGAVEIAGHEPMWAVVFIWVHVKYRQQKIACKLFDEAVKSLGLGRKDVAWYTPFTPAGRAFVMSLYPVEFFVAK
jgi:hypothetical protein